jgi:hypothetical protein
MKKVRFIYTGINEIPSNTTHLECQFISLPPPDIILPSTITHFYCGFKYGTHQLTSLPDLPNTLEVLLCQNNQLTSLPDLPDTLHSLHCNNNPRLYDKYHSYRINIIRKYQEKEKETVEWFLK